MLGKLNKYYSLESLYYKPLQKAKSAYFDSQTLSPFGCPSTVYNTAIKFKYLHVSYKPIYILFPVFLRLNIYSN